MNKKIVIISLALSAILPIAIFGCKGKVEKTPETMMTEATTPVPFQEEMASTQPVEPAQTVATETIPPTATPPAVEKPSVAAQEKGSRDRDIQKALKAAGFYEGSVDGKIGPKTKKAIEEFQKAKGLKADGKVGPKTWAELEKYLTQQ